MTFLDKLLFVMVVGPATVFFAYPLTTLAVVGTLSITGLVVIIKKICSKVS